MKDNQSIPGWSASLSASHPKSGGFYTVRFDDGLVGFMNIRPNGTVQPLGYGMRPFEDGQTYATVRGAVTALHGKLSALKAEKK